MNAQRIVVLILSILGMIGIFMPWVSIPFATVNGIDANGDQWVVVAGFGICLIMAFVGDRKWSMSAGALVTVWIFSLGVAALGIYEISEIKRKIAEDPKAGEVMKVGNGLYLIVVAGILMPILAQVMNKRRGMSEEEIEMLRVLNQRTQGPPSPPHSPSA